MKVREYLPSDCVVLLKNVLKNTTSLELKVTEEPLVLTVTVVLTAYPFAVQLNVMSEPLTVYVPPEGALVFEPE